MSWRHWEASGGRWPVPRSQRSGGGSSDGAHHAAATSVQRRGHSVHRASSVTGRIRSHLARTEVSNAHCTAPLSSLLAQAELLWNELKSTSLPRQPSHSTASSRQSKGAALAAITVQLAREVQREQREQHDSHSRHHRSSKVRGEGGGVMARRL